MDALESRVCPRCFRRLELSDFGPNGKAGLRPACRECERLRKRKYPKITAKKTRPYISSPEATRARGVIRELVRQGRLKRPPCSVCGQANAEAHHEDYSRPLDVKWLCHRHHCEHHRKPVDPICEAPNLWNSDNTRTIGMENGANTSNLWRRGWESKTVRRGK
jgi:hypothetical protein